ncbi:MAG TPA: ORF6N domain-containing protein [Bacteroidales bacterium]|nr:ORF6N domain-containing protein [Bacteroidales bacterium]HQI70600.1 ORF6N domain-containing protein [Bacteroidales bacterium]
MNERIAAKEIITQIFYIRGRKVMLDFHLVGLYEVETMALKQQVNRNIERFPEDFMFRLTEKEWKELITICDNLGAFKFSPVAPYAFTGRDIPRIIELS